MSTVSISLALEQDTPQSNVHAIQHKTIELPILKTKTLVAHFELLLMPDSLEWG